MLRSLATSGTELPAASFASASRSLRTICSGEYPLPIQSPPSAHLGRSDSHSSWTSFRGAGHEDPHKRAPLSLWLYVKAPLLAPNRLVEGKYHRARRIGRIIVYFSEVVLRVFEHRFGFEVTARGHLAYHALFKPQEEDFFGFCPRVGAQAGDRLRYTHHPPL